MIRNVRRVERRPTLREIIDRVIIIAYQEDVRSLVSSLTVEGFNVEVQRLEYTKEEMEYTSASRTFLSHRKAWQKAITGYTLVCEADFVPCRGMGKFEVFWPLENAYAWGYLYQGSPRLLAIVGSQRFLRSHTSPMVCYVINKNVASLMLMFFEQQNNNYDFRTYFTFESHLQWYLMGLGGEAFMPRCHYGEHGGSANPEHASLGKISRQGQHRADNLMGSLHFLPGYADGKVLLFLRVRLGARLIGITRLVTGRWIMKTDAYHLGRIDVLKMYLVGSWRLLGPPY